MNLIRYYYANEQNEPVGPFQFADLEMMLSTGILEQGTQVCPEGGVEWVTLGSLSTASAPAVPRTLPPRQARKDDNHSSNPTANAGALAAASLIFPAIVISLTLFIAANPFIFAMAHSLGTEFLLFILIFSVGTLGPINAYKLLRVPGIARQHPKATVFAWIGIALFVLSLGVLLLVGLGLEAEMTRRAG